MKINSIFYAGNPYIEEDSLALKVAEKLKVEFPEIKFKHIQNTFQLLDQDLSNALILDVADSIERVTVLSSKNIRPGGNFSAHDFDLGYFFQLSEQEAKIIAIPMEYNLEKATIETSLILKQFFVVER